MDLTELKNSSHCLLTAEQKPRNLFYKLLLKYQPNTKFVFNLVFLLDEQMGKEIFLQGLITHTGLGDQADIASKSWINEENIKSNKNPAILWCALFSSSDWCKIFLLFILQGKPLKSQHFSFLFKDSFPILEQI